jgi:hypothetical protein
MPSVTGLMRAACASLEGGLRTEDWESVREALAMLLEAGRQGARVEGLTT